MSAVKQAARKKSTSFEIEIAKYFDTKLMFAVVMLLGIGLVMVASSSIEIADRATGDPLYYFKRQFIFALMGISAGFALTKIRLTHWKTLVWQFCCLWWPCCCLFLFQAWVKRLMAVQDG